jgi:hypothetical protein
MATAIKRLKFAILFLDPLYVGTNRRSEQSIDLRNLGSAAAEQGRSRDPLLHQAGGHLELGSRFSRSGFNGFGNNGLYWVKMDLVIMDRI